MSRLNRRLAAILAADMCNFSRLVEIDELETIKRQKNYLKNLFGPKLEEHRGRTVKLLGDGLLAEFGSVIDAVNCAIEIQTAMDKAEKDSPEQKRIVYRIGVNVGDVIVDEEDIYGDGVNIAARLEGLASPGGICISEKVFNEISGKVNADFKNVGERKVKNIRKPLCVYTWDIEAPPSSSRLLETTPLNIGSDRKAIAILPFENMSGDEEQEYFVDGIVEDIITDLSRISGLFVLSRSSSFAYKGKSKSPLEIGKELGVDYLVEGSVRKAGKRIRLTSQLIDGLSGGHLWAERFDRDLEDVFSLQDEITENIVRSLRVAISPSEKAAIERASTNNMDAYEFYLRGRKFLHEMTKRNLEHARSMFLKAVEIDSNYALAFAGIADCDSVLYIYYSSDDRLIQDALNNSQIALNLSPNLAEAHASIGLALSLSGDNEASTRSFDNALSISPTLYEAFWYSGLVRIMQDDFESSSKLFEKASSVRGEDLQSLMMQMTAFKGLKKREKLRSVANHAYEITQRRLKLNPDDSRAAYICALCLIHLGDKSRALEMARLAAAMDSNDSRTNYNLACIFSMLEQTSMALDHLKKVILSGRPLRMLEWAKTDPDLSNINNEEQFHDLLETWRQFG